MRLKNYYYCFIVIVFCMACKTPAAETFSGSYSVQADTLFHRAAAKQQAGDFKEAAGLYKQMFALQPPSDEAGHEAAPVLKEALLQLMYCHFFSGQRGSAAAWYTAFYADTTQWMVRHYPRNVEICLGYSLYEAARLPEAVEMIGKALSRPDDGIPAGELYADYGIAGAVYNQTGDVRRAIACTEKCAALLRTLGNKTDLVNALGNLIYQYQQVGEFDRSLAAYEELAGLEETKDNPYQRCVAEVNILSLFEEWGLEEEVEKHLAAARTAAVASGIPDALLRVVSWETNLRFRNGETEAALRLTDTLAGLLPEAEEGSFYRIYYQDFCLLADLLGGKAGAEGRALQRLAELQAKPMDRLRCNICSLLGDAFRQQGRTAEAITAYRACVEYVSANGLYNPQRRLYQSLARLCAREGNYAEAARYYELYDKANAAFTERRNAGLMSQFRVKYETREKEQANELLRAEVQLQRRNLQYYTMAGIAAALLIVLAAIWGVMRHRALRQQHELDARQHELDLLRQQETERLLKARETELRRMLKERLEMSRINEELRAEITRGGTPQQLYDLIEHFSPRLLTQEEEQQFRRQFIAVHPDFLSTLRSRFPTVSHSEELLAMLLRLNLNNEEVALVMGINRNSVNTLRSRLRKKLDLPTNEPLEDFMKKL